MKKLILIAAVQLLIVLPTLADRAEIATVSPVTKGRLRFEIADGYSENKQGMIMGGYVRVFDEKEHIEKCVKRVYRTKNDKRMEADAQENYITALNIKGPYLIVERERSGPVKIKIASLCKELRNQ